MPAPERRERLLQRMAWLCAALVLAITSLSAFIRLAQAGLDCTPWPQCHELVAQRADAAGDAELSAPAAPSKGVAIARLAHRVVASVALVLVLIIVMTALSSRPVRPRVAALALSLLVLVVFLAVLGRWSAQARVPAVTLGNLLAGLLLFALCVRLARATGTASAQARGGWGRPAWRVAALAGAVLLVLQIAVGGLVSARHAGSACAGALACEATGSTWRVLDPWFPLAAHRGAAAFADAALLQGLHRAWALLTLCVLVPVGVAAWRRGRRAGAALAGLLALQAAIGLGLIGGGPPLVLALAHNVVAALLLAVTLSLIDAPAGAHAPSHLR